MKKIAACVVLAAALVLVFAAVSRASITVNGDGSRSLTIKLGTSAAQSAAVLDNLAFYFGWSAATGETKQVYVERMVRETIRAWAREGQLAEAAKIARDTESAKTPVDMQ